MPEMKKLNRDLRDIISPETSKAEICNKISLIGVEGRETAEEYQERVNNAEVVSGALKQLKDTVVEGKMSRLQANRGFAGESVQMETEGRNVEQNFYSANEIPKDSLSEKIVMEKNNEGILIDTLAHVHAAGFSENFINEKIGKTIENVEDFDNDKKEIDNINEELNDSNVRTFNRLNDAVKSLD